MVDRIWLNNFSSLSGGIIPGSSKYFLWSLIIGLNSVIKFRVTSNVFFELSEK
jgi:hypothetical protein